MPSRAAEGRWSFTSSKYSCKCPVIDSFVLSIGSTSMKRNIWALTDSSCMAQAMIRSSHQRRSKMLARRREMRSKIERPSSCVVRSILARSRGEKSSA